MKKLILNLTFLLGSLCSVTAAGETNTYVFLPDQSTVVQTGGFAGVHEIHSVTGQFELTVDFKTGAASFDQVDAILSESPFLYTRSLGVLFNMTELTGTVISDTEINFVGKTAEVHPVDVNLVVTLKGSSVEMTGGTNPPCCDFFVYNLDAVALISPITYYVDAVNGDDNNDGLSPKTAFATIQKGIDVAEDGDTVIVYPGLYTENINFLGKNITLASTKPNNSNVAKRTTIAGSVRFRGTENAKCMLTGFNIDGYITGFDWEIDPYGKNHTHATISHCVLENIITGCGRVIWACDGTISNCVIANISYMCLSPWPTPAIVGCHGLFKNCTLANAADGIEILPGGTCTIENCIIYRSSPIIVHSGATLNISYCDLQGGLDWFWVGGTVNWGPGNIDADPCFARLGDWQVEGDFHLKSQAGRWTSASSVEPDAKEGRWTRDDVTSQCIDAGDPMSPIGFEPFPNGGRINMGAYGGTFEASKSYFGRPVCETIIAGDINGDCKVNFKDFALMALHWLECIEPNQGRRHLVEDDTEDSYSCEGNFDVSYPCSNAVDEDWDTYALPADGGAASCIYENYIIPSGIAMADFTIKYRQTAPVTPGLCTNVTDYWDGSTWKELNCTALTNQISTLTVRIPDDALSRSALQLRTRIWKSLGLIGSGSGMYYEGKVIWYLLPVCQTIVAGDINSE